MIKQLWCFRIYTSVFICFSFLFCCILFQSIIKELWFSLLWLLINYKIQYSIAFQVYYYFWWYASTYVPSIDISLEILMLNIVYWRMCHYKKGVQSFTFEILIFILEALILRTFNLYINTNNIFINSFKKLKNLDIIAKYIKQN